MQKHVNEFKEDYETNKKLVEKFADVSSKKIRNIIAGYVTRLIKTRKT